MLYYYYINCCKCNGATYYLLIRHIIIIVDIKQGSCIAMHENAISLWSDANVGATSACGRQPTIGLWLDTNVGATSACGRLTDRDIADTLPTSV
jgi:hypothetical protein